jgi:hypothetical protein
MVALVLDQQPEGALVRLPPHSEQGRTAKSSECEFVMLPAVLSRVQATRCSPGGRICKVAASSVQDGTRPTGVAAADQELTAEAKRIRDLCGRPRVATAREVVEQIAALGDETAARVVSLGNRNKKAALHFAAQMRTGEDCVEICRALLDRGAAVNCTTRRGHTALIFAAGRGRNTAVSYLLSRGADPRIITVTGHTAAQMGQGRLDESTQTLLEAAQESCSAEWRDFRKDPDALDAQAEHVHHCPSCRAKLGGGGPPFGPMPCAQRRPADEQHREMLQLRCVCALLGRTVVCSVRMSRQ